MTEYARISTPSRSAAARASPTGRTLNPRITASEAAASMTSDSVMPPTPELITLTWISSCGRRAISSSKASSEPGTASLGLVAQPHRALVGQLAGAAVVVDHPCVLAGLGDAVEAEHLDRVAGTRGVDALAVVVDHRADAAPVGAGHERVADAQRAALDEQRHHRAAPGIELGLDDHAAGRRVRVGLELLELGHHEDRVQQVVEPLVRLGRHVDELGVAAPLGGLQVQLRHLRAHAGGVGALLV